ncbi:MAG: hypothetical protein J0I84_04955 [Terrimonas sp.]|mgnify:CR=1 FL=1|nr:hypothetical protein [Terrimonas sp.]OJY89456.1 MAG: hypothetical protein BGP13_03120 [Sphingobacteriales bacterium 40-81]
MRPIDRLYRYLNYKKIKPYTFEQSCNISNGYLNKQFKGKGAIGSDIVEKIHKRYEDLNLKWVLTGTGEMIVRNDNDPVAGNFSRGGAAPLSAREEVIVLLRKQVTVLEAAVADKDRIIALLEEQLNLKKNSTFKNVNKED